MKNFSDRRSVMLMIMLCGMSRQLCQTQSNRMDLNPEADAWSSANDGSDYVVESNVNAGAGSDSIYDAEDNALPIQQCSGTSLAFHTSSLMTVSQSALALSPSGTHDQILAVVKTVPVLLVTGRLPRRENGSVL